MEEFINGTRKQDIEVQSFLNEDVVLFDITPNKTSLILSKALRILPLVLIWLFFDIAFVLLLAFKVGDELGYMWFFLVPFILIHVLPLLIWSIGLARAVIIIKDTRYIITDKKIIIQSSYIGLNYQVIALEEIYSLRIKRDFVDRLFKVGDLVIFGCGKTLELSNIENPEQIFNAVKALIN